MDMIIKITLPPISSNTYILRDDKSNKCIIIDPASNAEVIKAKIESLSLTPALILLTHGHFDHISAGDELRDIYDVPLGVHEEDEKMLYSPILNASSLLLGSEIKLKKADMVFRDGEAITISGITLKAMHTPGHTEGSTVFLGNGFAFSGDTLFASGYGRYDLPGGSAEKLFASLKKLFLLDENIIVYPGHGEETTISREKALYKLK